MEKAFNIRHFKDAADYTKNFIVQGEIDRYLPGGRHFIDENLINRTLAAADAAPVDPVRIREIIAKAESTCETLEIAETAALMRALTADRRYAIDGQALCDLQERYAAGYASETEVHAEIARMWKDEGYLMDTHTAVASAVLRKYRNETGDNRRTVVVSTASPYKFGPAVLSAVAGAAAVEGKDDFECCRRLQEISGLPEPDAIRLLPELPVRHTAECEKEEMPKAVLSALANARPER